MTALTLAASSSAIASDVIYTNETIEVRIPDSPLAKNALELAPTTSKKFSQFTEAEDLDTVSSIKAIVNIWQNQRMADQYMLFGKEGDSFRWEVVPYETTNSSISKIAQQTKVLWNIIFGGNSLSTEEKEKVRNTYQDSFTKHYTHTFDYHGPKVPGPDAFIDQKVIDRQLVLEGERVRVLYNYAPIGFGGEKLHFLIIPKEQKEFLTDLSPEEFQEAMSITRKLLNCLGETREIQDVYFFNKNGPDAGQTVPHWHLHVIVTTNRLQDTLGKLTIMKNILFGASPMPTEELRSKVEELRDELSKCAGS